MASKTLCPFIVYDFETSGTNSNKNAVVEVAMVAIKGDTLQEIARYEAKAAYKYNPSHEYTDGAEKVHGITAEDLMANGLSIKEFVEGIVKFLQEVNKHTIGKFQKPILVGHNIQDFDNDFLMAIADYTKTDLSKLLTGRKDYWGKFQPAAIDTLHLSRMKWQDDETMNDFKLGTVVEKAGLELPDAHRAMNDVLANKDVFVSFISDLRIDNSGAMGIGKKIRFREHFQFA